MRCPRQTNAQEWGFTLIELLVVISILTLIMAASFGAVMICNKSFEAGITRANHTEQLRATSDLLRRQFSQLVPVVHEFDGETVSSFVGNSERIRFIAPAPQNGGNAGLFVYTVSSQRIDGRQQLILSYSPYNPGQRGFDYTPASWRRTLIESMTDIRFAYYGAASADSIPDWHDEWLVEDDAFPRMVRILLVGSQKATEWPDLSFIIRAGDRQ